MKLSPVLLYTIIVSLGGFIFGFDASVISGTANYLTNEFQLDDIQLGFVFSAPTLGAIIATLTAGVLSDILGRRNLLRIIAALYLLSAIASAFAPTYWTLVVARFIGGLAFCSLMVAPMYIAEISQPEKRGKMVSINQLNIVVGFSAAYFANYFLLDASQNPTELIRSLGIDTNTWRWMLGLEILPALVWLILLFFIPPSPRWLALKNQDLAAEKVLKNLHGDSAEHSFKEEIAEIRESLAKQDRSLKSSLKFLFGSKMRFALVIGLIVGIAQQVTGINAVFFYAPSIFEQSGVGTNAAFSQAVLVGLINVIFTVVAMALIDKLGRKPLLIFGLAGVVMSMALCSYGFSQATYKLQQQDIVQIAEQYPQIKDLSEFEGVTYHSDVAFKNALIDTLGKSDFNKAQGEILKLASNMNATVILLGILGFVASFAVSLGPVMWVMFSEIFPNHIRGIAISFVGVINSMVSFTVTLVFPWELSNWGAATTFFIYGASALLGLVLVMKLFPETKGKTLEQLEVELSRA
ncbi:sugar porter family MFS transporter [Thalassotalea maritima]|uniref:sugar porter family MFS transporter n=1 Tax=Thalassotalea maritima TaxID=3242416 RepID=UPI003528C9DC